MTETVELSSGTTMPMVGFGTWRLSGQQAREAVSYALEVGYRHIDTATMYRNEGEVGRAVRDSAVPRQDIFITTKLPAERRSRIRQTLEESLSALDTDYLDLWLIHWPPGDAAPDVWAEFIKLRDEGLTRAIGVSNYSIAQIEELTRVTGETPSVNQIPWSPPKHYDPAVLDEHRRLGVVLEGYSSLKDTNLKDKTITEIAARHGVTPAQVVLRWNLEHGVVVIPKSDHSDRIVENFTLDGFQLTPAEVVAIDEILDLRDLMTTTRKALA
jgi:2,5-diketo-D-gluconate reductase A